MNSFTCPKCQTANHRGAVACFGCGVNFAYENQAKIKEEKPKANNSMKALLVLIWILPIAGVAVGAFILVGGMMSATSAPQEAVVCALACACAILPYCLARSITEIANQAKN